MLNQAVQAEDFPKPTSLQKDVGFWLKVYTEVTTRQGYIHDAQNLAVIYDRIDLGDDRRKNRKKIKQIKKEYAKALHKIANGKRINLSRNEARVLQLWGAEVSNERLLQAAEDIRFQLGQSNRFKQGVIRSGEWRDYIDSVFSDMGLPKELAILPHVESSFNPNAYSRVGAAGLWQFIRATGRRYMTIDYIVDERMDPFAATRAAARLLQYNHEIIHSWPLALTAYNHGLASMRRAVNTIGTRDIEVIVRNYKGRYFGFASRNFYVAFLAALEVDQNPEKYFGPLNKNQPYDYSIFKLKHYISAKDLSKASGISIEKLRQHNRSLLEPVWNGSKHIPKGFLLRIPKAGQDRSLQSVVLAMPADQRHRQQTPDVEHRVVRGDTLSEIAKRYGYKVSELRAVNGIGSRNIIRIGQKLRLPVDSAERLASVRLAKIDQATSLIAKPSVAGTVKSAEVKADDLPVKNVVVKNEEVIEIVESLTQAPTEHIAEGIDNTPVATDSAEVEESAEVIEANLLSDPSDYTVAADLTIQVQASETLGHYADWLDIRASRLRKINKMRYGKPVIVGHRISLDFSQVNVEQFERKRLAFQQQLQGEFFDLYRIASTYTHTVKRGESLWVLTLRKFKVPLWLLIQHNPDLDLNKIHPGIQLVVPGLVPVVAD
ncbi:MAG: transglycosylase SLT domain-containing protein [Gammaproteobacteria bacterium]|nr:transglycosylase SLT domain-containing protein [Gammaproteobacteria bacterium]